MHKRALLKDFLTVTQNFLLFFNFMFVFSEDSELYILVLVRCSSEHYLEHVFCLFQWKDGKKDFHGNDVSET